MKGIDLDEVAPQEFIISTVALHEPRFSSPLWRYSLPFVTILIRVP